jgi:hypothetical protein
MLLVAAAVASVSVACPAFAHTGGPLDADGCHTDHRTDTYHCHRGAAAGYTFPNREAMLEAVRTGKFPEKTVDEEGFFSKLWPWGKHHEQQEAGTPAEAAQAGNSTAAANPAGSDKERDVQEKLKVLQGLYEMGLITKDEYEVKRKAIIDQI